MMKNNSRSHTPSGEPKAAKRSILGLLFVPKLGSSFDSLSQSTRIFLHLLAGVFSLYGLLPKDYPGLHDPDAPMSMSHIVGSAWQNVEFTRAGAPRAILFFAVFIMMGVSLLLGVSALLSLFVGHAHAETTTSAFTVGSGDVAQSWLEYLFNAGSFVAVTDTYGSGTATLSDPFYGSIAMQSALIKALAFYSDAILVVAALILFYHLTSMVVETAHHGVAMGKRASQIWAPIRLVVAIGLLVPVNGGLNSGQYIVIKVAELGSALASNTWGLFLDQLKNTDPQMAAPHAPIVQKIAEDAIRMEACKTAWNDEIKNVTAGGVTLDGQINQLPGDATAKLGGVAGTMYHYTPATATLSDIDFCGRYFLASSAPSSGASSTLLNKAAEIQNNTFNAALSDFTKAAESISSVMDKDSSGSISLSATYLNAISNYQSKLDSAMSALKDTQSGQFASAVNTIKPYGWVMAGTFLNTIDRMQGEMSDAAMSSTPKTKPPLFAGEKMWNGMKKGNPDLEDLDKNPEHSYNAPMSVREKVIADMSAFDTYMAKVNSQGASDAACATLYGMTANATDASAMDQVFGVIDEVAQYFGVWGSSTAGSCGHGSTNRTFKMGLQIDGTDPFAQLAALGHNNLNVASELMQIGISASSGMGSTSGDSKNNPFAKLAGAGGAAVGGILNFGAMIFFICGFTLAFLVPLMPFMYFFFSVLSWVGGILEAIVAMPLVALAHLNPEGEGLPGQSARGAYFFIFNLFLRPVLTIFGFICAYILFLIAISFLNYGFDVAVTGAGGTAYGAASMSRVVYSIIYVVLIVTCANHAFQFCDHVPNNALKWIGQSGQAMPKMGDTGKVEGVGSMISSYAGMQGFQQIDRGAAHVGEKKEQALVAQRDHLIKGEKIISDSHADQMAKGEPLDFTAWVNRAPEDATIMSKIKATTGESDPTIAMTKALEYGNFAKAGGK